MADCVHVSLPEAGHGIRGALPIRSRRGGADDLHREIDPGRGRAVGAEHRAVRIEAVDDINQAGDQLVAAGATVQQQPRNVGGGKLVASVKDADGNVTGLMQNP
jgi:hypothetical protein